jgi:branched-chain amino acid transport system ATP-binding protein
MSAANGRDLLSIEKLSVFYDQFRALHEVDLTVGAGEVVSIIGANGAGKSSLLKAIVGRADRIDGTVRYDGRDLAGRSTAAIVADGIALVPEGRRLFRPDRRREPPSRRGSAAGGSASTTCMVISHSPGAAAPELLKLSAPAAMVALGRALLANRAAPYDEISLA